MPISPNTIQLPPVGHRREMGGARGKQPGSEGLAEHSSKENGSYCQQYVENLRAFYGTTPLILVLPTKHKVACTV